MIDDLRAHEAARLGALSAAENADLRRFVEGECAALIELHLEPAAG